MGNEGEEVGLLLGCGGRGGASRRTTLVMRDEQKCVCVQVQTEEDLSNINAKRSSTLSESREAKKWPCLLTQLGVTREPVGRLIWFKSSSVRMVESAAA